ncbi:YeeE/YedE family protein [Vibrio sp. S9_S30]|uniref:YeeE/YedE family protein n=1 Tax=Vibrio sp. S9_S30 TaxID=2720226 RepID=UPI001680BB14|nr:YeeE/YedE family protein [Vibrio sp. S9_S30]MBD1557039.1 YeeE/YedE family protein [Vibrio sp. S9_S30]
MCSSKNIRNLAALVAGLLFGAGMHISGMVNPDLVIAFLDVTGHWDSSLAFVMAGALFVFIPFYHLLIKPRKTSISGDAFKRASDTNVDGTLVTGATIFGVGWGLAGICPGPVIASVGAGSHVVMTFTFTMLLGMALANKYLDGQFSLPLLGYHKRDDLSFCAQTRNAQIQEAP